MVVPSNGHHLGTFEGERKQRSRGFDGPPDPLRQDCASFIAISLVIAALLIWSAVLAEWGLS